MLGTLLIVLAGGQAGNKLEVLAPIQVRGRLWGLNDNDPVQQGLKALQSAALWPPIIQKPVCELALQEGKSCETLYEYFLDAYYLQTYQVYVLPVCDAWLFELGSFWRP